jgi:hypothetical protein
MSDGLVAFFRAQLNEDEQVAEAVKAHGVDYWHQPDDWAELSAPAAAHAQRHDPARVLAEVHAKRQIIDQYENVLRAQQRHDAAVAELDADIEHEEHTGEWAGAGQPDVRVRALRREADYLNAIRPILEELLRAQASVYPDTPDQPHPGGDSDA